MGVIRVQMFPSPHITQSRIKVLALDCINYSTCGKISRITIKRTSINCTNSRPGESKMLYKDTDTDIHTHTQRYYPFVRKK